MALVIRMKNVSRVLIFVGSLLLWVVLLTFLNGLVFNVKNDYLVLLAAAFVGLAQTWVVAMVLHT